MPNILLPMNMHNVFRECDYDARENTRHANAKVYEFMVPLINELARRRPTWTFVSRSSSVKADTVFHYARFDVRVGDGTIGLIDMDVNWRDGTKSYEFDCRQLRAKRSRGSSTRTKDLKKATKLITENFHELSYGEHVQKAEQNARQASYKVSSTRRYEFTNIENAARNNVMSFLRDNWDSFITSVKDPVLQPKLLPLLELYDEAQAAVEVSTQIAAKGTFIKLLGDKYVVKRIGSDEVHIYTNQTLPDDLRGGMGALKLVAEDTVISGIGVRGTEDSFYLLPMEARDE